MRRVALAIDLDWPVAHHHGIVAGALQVGREKVWTCEVDRFLGFSAREPSRYDGVIGRVGLELARWAARTRTPVVNVWANSPDRRLQRVGIDFRAAGTSAARHFLDRGFRRFGF